VSGVESALAAREFKRALGLVETARRDFPSEHVFDELASRVAEAHNASDLDLARHRIAMEIDASRNDVALELLSVALKRFPSDQQLLAMEREARTLAKRDEPPAVIATGSSGVAATAPALEPESEPRRRAITPLMVAGAAVLLLAAGGVLMTRRPAAPQTPGVQPVAEPASAATPQSPPQRSVRPPQVAQTALDRPNRDASVPSRKTTATEDVEPTEAPAVASERPLDSPRELARPPNAVPADNTGRVGDAPALGRAGGISSGKLVWSGQLQPGEQIVLTDPQNTMPPFTDIVLTSIVPYGRVSVVEVAAGGLTVANNSSVVVTSIEISWRLQGPR
jgi:hypothetical protein